MSESFSASMLRRLSRFEGWGCGDIAEWPSGKLSAGDGLPFRTMVTGKTLEVWCGGSVLDFDRVSETGEPQRCGCPCVC
jgi:hypothetical protein